MDEALRQKLKKLPVSPGVYFHKSSAGDYLRRQGGYSKKPCTSILSKISKGRKD